MKKVLFILFVGVIVSSCSTLKLVKMLKEGDVEQPAFTSEVPFEMRMGLVVIKVNIDGKEYDFLVDTGAPNVVSKELAAELKLKPKVYQKTGDSQGRKEELGFVEMPEMLIGGIHFIETAAAVADLKLSKEIACLNVDGFIGANLMKEAVWEFDYQRKIITIADTIGVFSIPDNALKIPFTPAASSTPLVDVTYDGVTDQRVTFDTGSNDYFNSSDKVYTKLKENGKGRNPVISCGASSSGLYGVGKEDSTYTFTIGETKLGTMTIPGQAVSFTGGRSRTIGTKFFQHYRMIIDWTAKEIVLIPTDDFVNTTFETFGFTPMYDGTKLVVKMIVIGSPADKEGIRLGDEILEINGRDYRNMTDERWCEMLYDEETFRKNTEIGLVVRNNGNERRITLQRNDLLLR